MARILIADDEARMRKLVRDFLARDGHTVLEASDGEEAVNTVLGDHRIDLILLDVMMPKMDGWEALSAIRAVSKVPVIMLTAKSEEQDELKGFSLGVDEYVTKPFSPKILVARVNALLRRTGGDVQETLSAGGIELNKSAHLVTVDGKPLDLSVKEFELLQFFLEHQGMALSREVILNHVWNYNYYGDARTIDTHVKKLRSKIGEKGAYISTIWGLGYKFEIPQENNSSPADHASGDNPSGDNKEQEPV